MIAGEKMAIRTEMSLRGDLSPWTFDFYFVFPLAELWEKVGTFWKCIGFELPVFGTVSALFLKARVDNPHLNFA